MVIPPKIFFMLTSIFTTVMMKPFHNLNKILQYWAILQNTDSLLVFQGPILINVH